MSELIDYARPLMMAELALKNAHQFLLDEDYGLALDQLKLAIVETRTASMSAILMQEKKWHT